MTLIDAVTPTAVTPTAAPPPAQSPAPSPAHSVYQIRVADYWNSEENPVNLELGRIDDLYHHHYGIGDVDWSVLDDDPDPARRRARVTELHRLEQAQAELLARHLGPLSPPTASSTPAAGGPRARCTSSTPTTSATSTVPRD